MNRHDVRALEAYRQIRCANVLEALRGARGRVDGAAAALGISTRELYREIRELGITGDIQALRREGGWQHGAGLRLGQDLGPRQPPVSDGNGHSMTETDTTCNQSE